MLVIEENSVYEIDEECIRKKRVPKECRTYEKVVQEREKTKATEGESGKRIDALRKS